MGLNRRDFIGVAGGSALGFSLRGVPVRKLVGLDDQVVHASVPGIEKWTRTSCQICPGGCGMEVRLVDGVPVGVRGNRLHPVNRGGLCPVGSEALHLLYHPDRFDAPLVRGSQQRPTETHSAIEWEAALGQIATKIGELRAAGEAERIVVFDGYGRGLLSGLAKAFLGEIGSKGYYLDRRPDPMRAAMKISQGTAKTPAPDFENAATVLSFGAPLLEGWESPMQGHRAVGTLRRASATGKPRELIQIDTRYSKTAQRADRYLCVPPGTHGAVALSIAYVLISQELYDEEFVERHTFGFEDWVDPSGVEREGFKNFVLHSCRPEDMEAVTGVAPRQILEIARRFGESRPSIAISEGVALSYSNGVQSAHAIAALNALVGGIERPGGVLIQDEVATPFEREGTAEVSAREPEELVRAVRAGGPAPALVFLLHSDPFFSSPRGARLEEIIAEDTTVVSFSPLKDASSAFADYILPDHTFLERWQDCAAPATFSNALLGVTRPVTAPLFDTRDSGEVLLDLLHRSVPESLERVPWKTFEELLAADVRLLFEQKRGSTFTGEREASEIREMEQRGWWIPSHRSFDEFWGEMLASGGWWDPAYPYQLWGRALRTPDQRFHFVAGAGGEAGDDAPSGPPRHEDVAWAGERGEDTLALELFLPVVPNTAVAANMPWVRELVNPEVPWETWAELHSEDGEALGIENGDEIEIQAHGASFLARARVSEDGQRGLVAVPYGLGRERGGPWARAGSCDVNSVALPTPGAGGRGSQRQGTRVRVRKVEGGANHA